MTAHPAPPRTSRPHPVPPRPPPPPPLRRPATLGRARRRAGRSARTAAGQRLRDGPPALQHPLRQPETGGRRVRLRRGRHQGVPGLRQDARHTRLYPQRRPFLRRLVQRRRPARHRHLLARRRLRRRVGRGGRRGRQAHRRARRARPEGPYGPGRFLRHGRHLRSHPRRRSWGRLPRVRSDLRQPHLGDDHHRRRQAADRRRRAEQGPLLGAAGRRQRQLRSRHRAALPYPPRRHRRRREPQLAVVESPFTARGLAGVGPRPAGRDLVLVPRGGRRGRRSRPDRLRRRLHTRHRGRPQERRRPARRPRGLLCELRLAAPRRLPGVDARVRRLRRTHRRPVPAARHDTGAREGGRAATRDVRRDLDFFDRSLPRRASPPCCPPWRTSAGSRSPTARDRARSR